MRPRSKEDAIALAGCAAAKAAYTAMDNGEAKETDREEVRRVLDAIPESEPRPRVGLGRTTETIAEVRWGLEAGRVRLVRSGGGGGELSIEGDLAGAPRWALRAISEAARTWS